MTKKRIVTAVLAAAAVIALLGSGFSLGWKVGRQYPETIIVKGVSGIDDGKPENVDFGTFWQAWREIDRTHITHEEIGPQERLYGAITGLVGSLGDRYSEFLPPDDIKKFEEDIGGSFGGIGAELGARDNYIVVVAPLKNTPAERAGIQSGDKILAVNSSSTFNLSIDQAVKWIRGPVGEKVTLTILRDEWETSREIVIVRETIVIPTLETEIIDGNIAHVRFFSFNANAPMLFYDEVLKILRGNARGMILDLRNNPGGFLEVAVDFAGWFVPRGSLVVSQEEQGQRKKEFRATGNAALVNFPLVILVNKGSASASEILAGAIKVYRANVQLVGEKTFGKGTVQELRNLRDGSALKLTTANWVLPNGKIIEGEGVEPDFEVEITDEDREAGRDPQLEKAVEILKAEISK